MRRYRENLKNYGVYIYNENFNQTFKPVFETHATSQIKDSAQTNKAIQQLKAELQKYEATEKIGVLITKSQLVPAMLGEEEIYTTSAISNTYSHCYQDCSNWVTVQEAFEFVGKM